MKNKMDISIIIPTFNYSKERSSNLNRLLMAIKSQATTDIKFEIIVVDNGNSLNEEEFIEKYRDLSNNLKVVHEPIVGLSYARNSGIKHSTGEIIAFLDDDVLPSQNWLNALFKAHLLSSALCVGGPVIENKQSNFTPIWFSEYFLRFFVPPKFPNMAGEINAPFYLIGANMSFKKIAFDKFGLFDVNLGRKGHLLLSGEDTEFMIRLPSKEVYFDPEMMVRTDIERKNMTRLFCIKRIFWQAISDARIIKKHGPSKLYDKKELFFSLSFFKDISYLLREGMFFQFNCVLLRIFTFKLFLILKI